MSTLSVPTPPPTVAPPALLTAEEFAARHAHRHAELVKGVLQEYPMPMPKHGFICSRIAYWLTSHIEESGLGRVATNDSWIRTGSNPDTVRGADVSYYSYERLPRGDVPEGLLAVVPDLVVEVRSPSDRWMDLFIKIGEYLRAGVRVVVVLDPTTVSASAYRADELQQVLHNGDTLSLPDVLPGFSVPVARLFS